MNRLSLVDASESTFGLNPREMATLRRILKGFPEIKRVCIYGSRALGNYRTGSDIDLAIMEPATDLRQLNSIQSAFDESHLPMRVDLVDFHGLSNQALREHIVRAGMLIYGDEN